jgi:hypothetical protein
MRWSLLYLRSRNVPAAVALAVGMLATIWGLFHAVSDARDADLRVVVLTVLLVASPLAATLAAPDDALDRTAAQPWPVRRAAHAVVATALVIALLLATQTTAARFGPTGLVVRDAVGLIGLTLLAAALWGARRSWIAPTVWTVVAFAFSAADAGSPRHVQVLAWMVQDPSSRPASATAVVVAIVGAAAYTARGCPRPAASDPAHND